MVRGSARNFTADSVHCYGVPLLTLEKCDQVRAFVCCKIEAELVSLHSACRRARWRSGIGENAVPPDRNSERDDGKAGDGKLPRVYSHPF
jgi:hypothetical protein